MGWTVIKEDFKGEVIKALSKDVRLSNTDLLYSGDFKLLKYLNPYGDTTFNALMCEDLISDLVELKKLLPADKDQIEEIKQLAEECKDEIYSFSKFYGD